MSTAQKTLIDAIRRIALDSEALASALGALQKRGVIDGIKTTLGGYNELQDDCCTEGDGNPDDPSGEKDPIDEDAPPEVPDIGDEDGDGESEWSDCETGDPVTFAPGGFPQPETCKECEPDETWEEGYYWEDLSDRAASSANGLLAILSASAQDPIRLGEYQSVPRVKYEIERQVTFDGVTQWVRGGDIYRIRCPGRRGDLCVSVPPCLQQDWPSDGATNYTLADGCITASSCDPDASAQSQQCNECITICNEDGQERRVCAIGNGQWILYDPNGKYKGGRYDATGRRLEILPAGETGGYLPSERNPTGGGGYDGGTIGGGDGWVWS